MHKRRCKCAWGGFDWIKAIGLDWKGLAGDLAKSVNGEADFTSRFAVHMEIGMIKAFSHRFAHHVLYLSKLLSRSNIHLTPF